MPVPPDCDETRFRQKKPPLLKRLLHRIFPPAPDFFSLLNDLCDLAVESTAKLVEFMAQADPAVGAEIRELEHAGDRLKERNMDVLNRAFVTVKSTDTCRTLPTGWLLRERTCMTPS